MHHHNYSDEEECWSSSDSLNEDSVSDDDVRPMPDVKPMPYWDIVRHGTKFASYRFIVVHPDEVEDEPETPCEPSIKEDATTVLTVLPGLPPDDWGCRLRTLPPVEPVHRVDIIPPPPSDNPPSDNGCAWESHRLQQSLGLSIPQPPPVVEETPKDDGEDWCVIRGRGNNNKKSLLRSNISPIQRNNDTNTTDRKDLLCKLSHRSGSCQRAHNMSEWRPKECRRHTCRQTTCHMLHPATEDRAKLLQRLITIQGTFYHQHAQDFRRLYLETRRPSDRPSDRPPDRPPSRRGRGGRGSRR